MIKVLGSTRPRDFPQMQLVVVLVEPVACRSTEETSRRCPEGSSRSQGRCHVTIPWDKPIKKCCRKLPPIFSKSQLHSKISCLSKSERRRCIRRQGTVVQDTWIMLMGPGLSRARMKHSKVAARADWLRKQIKLNLVRARATNKRLYWVRFLANHLNKAVEIGARPN